MKPPAPQTNADRIITSANSHRERTFSPNVLHEGFLERMRVSIASIAEARNLFDLSE
jgi:hypothetical protein